ncbi:MAG: hypothetical protein WKF37_12690 [Bryobacteraceae bacterium]
MTVGDEYRRRLGQRREALIRHQTWSKNLSTGRLLVVLAGAALGWWNLWLLPPAVMAFAALLVIHEKVERSVTFERRAIAYYERGIARIEGKWSGSGETGQQFQDPLHPYAADLDLFGTGSVFQLLNAARTAAGEATLAKWLLQPGDRLAVLLRQAAVRDLEHRLDLREDVALLGSDVRAGVHPESLVRWGEQPREQVSTAMRAVALVFALSTAVIGAGFLFQLWPGRTFIICVLLQSVFALVVRNRVLRILASVNLPARDLGILSQLLRRFELETFQAERLIALKKLLDTEGILPSTQIARLHRLLECNDWGRNQMFAPIAKLLLWSTQSAFAIERWRRVSGPKLAIWIEAVGELEALGSLAGYTAEHSGDAFPELLDGGSPVVEGQGIAHPLLSASAVRNDVQLDANWQLLLISGSNMSGKARCCGRWD